MPELDEFQAAQVAEYGRWVAKEAINIGGVRAFNPGDPVPASHVENNVVSKDQVVGANTKTAAAVTGSEA
jgi:hypothetical protein